MNQRTALSKLRKRNLRSPLTIPEPSRDCQLNHQTVVNQVNNMLTFSSKQIIPDEISKTILCVFPSVRKCARIKAQATDCFHKRNHKLNNSANVYTKTIDRCTYI